LYDETQQTLELGVAKNFPFRVPLRLKLGEGGSGYVAQTRQPLIVEDYSTWEHRSPQAEGLPIRAALYVPLLFQDKLIGILNIIELNDSTRKFTEEDARLLTLFAAQAAAAVHNARLLQQTQQHAERLALLYDAALTLNRALEIQPIVEHLLNITTRTLHADHADFFRYDSATRTLRYESGSGYSNDVLARLREHIFSAGEARGLVGLVAQERTPIYLPDVLADSRYIIIDPTIRSALWVPVEHEEKLYGVLVVASTRTNAFSPADQRLVILFANQVAVALERASLFQAAQNRRAEISALYELARQLADANTLEAVCNVVVQHSLATLPITFARLALLEEHALVVCASQASGALSAQPEERTRIPLASLPHCQAMLQQHQPSVISADTPHLSALERDWLGLDSVLTLCCVPLYAEGQALGLLFLGAQHSPASSLFAAELLHHARNIGDQAAGAIRRARLREQTEQRLRQVQALHMIDMTISASMDINTTLQILLPTLMTQLQADAIALLLFNPTTHTLTYLAGRGFRTRAIETSTLGVGKEYAGRAVLERRTLSEPNLAARLENLQRHFLVTEEKFVSCVCTPLIAKGQIKGVLEFFFRTPFTPTPEWHQVLDAFSVQAALALDNAELFRNLQRTHTELSLSYEAMIEGWAHTIEAREQVSPGHNRRVADWALRVARALGVTAPQLQQIRYGALLHNLEYAFPPDVLSDPCTESTFEQTSARRLQKVYELLSTRPILRPLLDIPYSYHENWDGSGYPRGLHGEQIPLGARIVAVVDAWEHCVSQPNASTQTVRDTLLAQSGTRFDPHIVSVFLQLLEAPEESTPLVS
jgi:GAF domain-containing protein